MKRSNESVVTAGQGYKSNKMEKGTYTEDDLDVVKARKPVAHVTSNQHPDRSLVDGDGVDVKDKVMKRIEFLVRHSNTSETEIFNAVKAEFSKLDGRKILPWIRSVTKSMPKQTPDDSPVCPAKVEENSANNETEANALPKLLQSVDPTPEHREVPMIPGNDAEHPDAIAVAMGQIMNDNGNFYRHADKIVLDDEEELVTLSENNTLRSETPSIMANHVLIQPSTPGRPPQPPSRKLLQTVFNNNLFRRRLPIIEQYANRPIYSDKFLLQQPGFHPESSTLIHGDAIDVIPFIPSNAASPSERIPAILWETLIDFPFKTTVDFVNAVGMLLMAILGPIFTATGRAVGLFDGNQPGVGKTLFAEVLGIILDGDSPATTKFSGSNNELAREVLATIRSHSRQTVIVIDNARTDKGVIDSTFLEEKSVQKTFSSRILHQSQCHTGRNDYLWLVTMNCLRTTPDLAQRGIRIQFFLDDPASSRTYKHTDLAAFVKERRAEIIGTLFGMVEYWKSQGMPMGKASHRFPYMAKVVSGILEVCGLHGFLSNHQKSVLEIDSTRDRLALLFESTFHHHAPSITLDTQTFFVPIVPLSAQEWIGCVVESGIGDNEFALAKSNQGKRVQIGKLFSRLMNREFDIEIGTRSGKARLLKVEPSQKRIGYHFSVELGQMEVSHPVDSPAGLESQDSLDIITEILGDTKSAETSDDE